MTIILETKRLRLRHLTVDDLDELFRLYRDPEIRKYFPEGVLTLAGAREELGWHIDTYEQHPQLGLWATIHKETGRFIGRCGLLPWEIDGIQEIEIAYLIDKAFWNQGLATEAAQGLLRYGFENLNLRRMICLMHPDNLASQRVAEKIGMTREGEANGIAAENFPAFVYSISKASP
jgi:[ribosomal protein S5]-alanine N-acetyltransferase